MIEALILLLAVALGIGLALWLPGYLQRRVLRRPFPAEFVAILERNMPVYARMPSELQGQLQDLVKQFLHKKRFVGCAGLEITDEMRVTIAGKACLLLLNRPQRVYPGLEMVLVYPGAFVVPRSEIDEGGVVTHAHQHLTGESWADGRVILAWDHVLDGVDEEGYVYDVVVHEFAHQLDSESGINNGAPPLPTPARYRSWAATMSREYEELRDAAWEGADSVLDHYGATSPAEFFAVATETFFNDPAAMAESHPQLFAELQKYYRVDPRDWLPPETADGERHNW
jgi:Mlc titration factor MtfA (ptsG expression regulator)